MSIRFISGEELIERADDAYIIDARTPEEYAEGHIANTTNIPYDEMASRLDEVPKDQPIIVHCRTNQRSQFAASVLDQAGYEDISVAPGVDLFAYDLEK